MTTQDRRVIGAVVVMGLFVLGLLGLGIWWVGVTPPATNDPVKSVEFAMAGQKSMVLSTQPTESQIDGVKKMVETELIRQMREYGKMTPEQKKKHLDAMIDQGEEARKMGLLKVPEESQGAGKDGKADVRVEGTPTSRRVMIKVGGKSGDKQAMESFPPDIRALTAQFKADMSARRAERGLPDVGGITILRTETTTTTQK